MRHRRPIARVALTALTALAPVLARAQRSDSLLRPFTIEHRAADGSALDLSFLLDAPAGKRAFTRVRDGRRR